MKNLFFATLIAICSVVAQAQEQNKNASQTQIVRIKENSPVIDKDTRFVNAVVEKVYNNSGWVEKITFFIADTTVSTDIKPICKNAGFTAVCKKNGKWIILQISSKQGVYKFYSAKGIKVGEFHISAPPIQSITFENLEKIGFGDEETKKLAQGLFP